MIQSHPFISAIIIGLAIRPLVILLHELGHAIVALIIVKQKIVIFLGSYGDKERSANVMIGPVEIWFTGNPFLWQRGMCYPSVPLTRIDEKKSYILAGPILPLALSAIVADAAVFLEANEYIRFVSLVFFGVAMIDAVINLIPWSDPLAYYNNNPVYNDGYSLRLALLQKKYPAEFFVAINQYSKEQYDDATKNFERALKKRPNDKTILKFFQQSSQRQLL